MAFNRSKWYSGGVAIRGTKVLVFWYARGQRRFLKFPGGSQKHAEGRHDKTPVDTLVNELVGDQEMMAIGGGIKVLGTFYQNKINEEHTQFWFLVEPNGDIRTTDKVDVEEGMPDEFLSVPFWMDIREVWKHPETARLHREMIPRLIAYMAEKDADWGWLYQEVGVRELIAS